MNIEKIKVRTETGQTMEVVVLSKRASAIEIVLGEGVHNVKCTLSPSTISIPLARLLRTTTSMVCPVSVRTLIFSMFISGSSSGSVHSVM